MIELLNHIWLILLKHRYLRIIRSGLLQLSKARDAFLAVICKTALPVVLDIKPENPEALVGVGMGMWTRCNWMRWKGMTGYFWCLDFVVGLCLNARFSGSKFSLGKIFKRSKHCSILLIVLVRESRIKLRSSHFAFLLSCFESLTVLIVVNCDWKVQSWIQLGFWC